MPSTAITHAAIRIGIAAALLTMPLLYAQTWTPLGPTRLTGGRVTGITDGEVSGAIEAVIAHPTNPDVLWIGAVNGGVWRTENATDPRPTWTPLTDHLPSLAIGALALDAADPSFQTLVAGFGRRSNFQWVPGVVTGIVRTTDGGVTWTELDPAGALDGLTIRAVVAHGDTIVVAATGSRRDLHAILRSTDSGATFVDLFDDVEVGLPDEGLSHSIVQDPNQPSRLFTLVTEAFSESGIYRSDDTGAQWTRVSDAAVNPLLCCLYNSVLTVGPTGGVWAIMPSFGGQAIDVVHSPDGGTSWAVLDKPGSPNFLYPGIHPDAQATYFTSMVADPTDPNVVYVGGGRQYLPNDIGAPRRTGNLWRGDVSQPSGSQWVHLTDDRELGPEGGGTASGTAPHADSRALTFDATDDLIDVGNGGIYRRTSPRDDTGDWFSINGTLQIAELRSGTWDAVSGVVVASSHVTGTTYQDAGATTWSVLDPDAVGLVAVDEQTLPGHSIRYSHNDFQLGGFRRQVFDASNNLVSENLPALTTGSGSPPLVVPPTAPVVVNAAGGDRLVIGGSNDFWESYDGGETLVHLGGPGIGSGRVASQPIAYGAPGDPDVLYVATEQFGLGVELHVRTAPHPAPLVRSDTYPGDLLVRAVVLDPDQPHSAFAADNEHVYRTRDAGGSWHEITGDLFDGDPVAIHTLAYLRQADGIDSLVAGTTRGVFRAFENEGFARWSLLGEGLPNAPAWNIDHDPGRDLVVVTTMGRGAWSLNGPHQDTLFLDGFESGDTAAWTFTTP